jgi:hypothetical protein
VRVRDGNMLTSDGLFVETKEMLAGFVLLDARDLNEATQIAANDPFARMGFKNTAHAARRRLFP